MKRVADLVAEWLASAGVEDVFVLPGGGAMYLNDGVACEPRLRAIACQHEQACGIAAEAYGRVRTYGFGVAMVTTGPGATNILTPVAGAWIESLPLMVIAGQVKRSDALNGRCLRQSGVQEVDVLTMVKPITKYAARVDDPTTIIDTLENARSAMMSGRPGPVWIDIPLDVQASRVTAAHISAPNTAVASKISNVADHKISELNKLISTSRRPLILVGHGVRISGAAHQFVQLAESLRIPCVFTWNAADILHWDHPLYVGRPGNVAARAPNFAVQNCDLLISIGARLDNIVTAYNPQQFARNAKRVVVDVDSNEIEKHTFDLSLAVTADARDFIETWSSRLPEVRPEWREWIDICGAWKRKYLPGDRTEGAKKPSPVYSPPSHIEFVEELSRILPEHALIVTGSSGLAVEFFYTAFRNKFGQRFFLTSGLGSMGYGLPAAIGACIATGRKTTFCIESDGSIMLNIQELATVKTLNLPIVILVMNNGGYASIRNTQRNYFGGRYLASSFDSGLRIPALAPVAQSFGIRGERAISLDELSSLLAQMPVDEPLLIDVLLQHDEALSPKVAALPQPDGTMVSMPLEDMSPLLDLAILETEMTEPLLRQSYAARNLA